MDEIVQCKLCFRLKVGPSRFRNMGQDLLLKRYTGKTVRHGICADCFYSFYRRKAVGIPQAKVS